VPEPAGRRRARRAALTVQPPFGPVGVTARPDPHVVIRPGTEADADAAGRSTPSGSPAGSCPSSARGSWPGSTGGSSGGRGAFLLVADDGGAVRGVHRRHRRRPGLYRAFLRHDGLRASCSAAGRLVRSWRRVLETLRHGTSDGAGVGRGVELLAVAVDPGFPGPGIGAGLVDAFLERVRAVPSDAAYVVVASGQHVGRRALLARAGFVPGPEFELHAGTPSLLMQWDAAGAAAGDPS